MTVKNRPGSRSVSLRNEIDEAPPNGLERNPPDQQHDGRRSESVLFSHWGCIPTISGSMRSLNDLPLEVLAAIVQNVWQPRSLASVCLVSKVFRKFTQPFLYHTIAVLPWHHKEKVPHRELSCRSSET